MRISGVSVGKVVSVGLDRRTGLTRAVIQIDRQYAPRPADTRAILRAEVAARRDLRGAVAPASRTGRSSPTAGTLPQGQVAPTVQLDQILSTFDPATRQAFETWMQQDGIALTNRGQEFNAAIAQLYPFATNVELGAGRAATARAPRPPRCCRHGGQVFSALSARRPQLQG